MTVTEVLIAADVHGLDDAVQALVMKGFLTIGPDAVRGEMPHPTPLQSAELSQSSGSVVKQSNGSVELPAKVDDRGSQW